MRVMSFCMGAQAPKQLDNFKEMNKAAKDPIY